MTSKMDRDLTQANAAAAAAQIAYFRAIPWCATHLSDPRLVVDQSESRRLRPSAHHGLISRTLNTPDTIPAYITFFHPPSPTTLSSHPSSTVPSTSNPGQGNAQVQGSSGTLIRKVQAFIALGPALSGWDGVCHGGIVATLLDEIMGQVFAVNHENGLIPPFPLMTGYLNTRYERPVLTGLGVGGSSSGISSDGKVDQGTGTGMGARVVLVTARVVRNEGRKYWLEADVRGEDGVVMARGESLFIMLRGKL